MRGHHLLAAVAVGLGLAAAGFAAYDNLVLTKQGPADSSRLYDYTYASGKSESVGFVTSNMTSDGYLCFGSSEWYISKKIVEMCPQTVFGENVTGVNMVYLGEGYDQSLWQVIAAGAYANKVSNKKVMIVVSPQWFFKNNGDQSKFYTKFNYSLYRDFVQNSDISQETKDYVRQRVTDLGIDSGQVAAANHDTVVDTLNDVAYAEGDDLSLRSKLANVIAISPKNSATRNAGVSTGEPDWDALMQQAEADGEAACTNNDYGIYDAYWEKYHTYMPELYENFHEADAEYQDFACFLEVCRECGLEPLVTILPVHGQWYDLANVSKDERASYYQKIRDICDQYGAAYADFSSCEYEKYFLCDTVHPGWKGWVRIERSFYDFVNDRDDDFLGGSDFGDAPGLLAEQTGGDGQ